MVVGAGTASAVGVAHDGVVSAVPFANTPQIVDNKVFDIVQVGNRIVVAGSFLQIQNAPANGGAVFSQRGVFAFDPATGAIDRAFSPVINGTVNALVPGPNNTVYAGGTFTTVNGATGNRNLVQLSLATGQRTALRAPAMNGAVNDLALSGGRLYLGGAFTTVGAVAARRARHGQRDHGRSRQLPGRRRHGEPQLGRTAPSTSRARRSGSTASTSPRTARGS